MWDQMWRATINYGRKGLPLQAISAVDLAVWDLLGKLRGETVFNLLGGKVVERLPVYSTSSNPVGASRPEVIPPALDYWFPCHSPPF